MNKIIYILCLSLCFLHCRMPVGNAKKQNKVSANTIETSFTLEAIDAPPPSPIRIEKAKEIAQNKGKLLVVLSQPKDKKKRKHFVNYWNDYASHPADQYIGDEEQILFYDFYLADAHDDAQWLKNNHIPTDKNVYVICDYSGEVMYYREASVPEMQRQKLFYADTDANVRTTAVARLIDKVLTCPDAPIEKVEEVFDKLVTYNYDLQLHHIENYNLKIIPEQLSYQWKRLVEAHSSDERMNAAYVRLLIRNYSTFYNQNFSQAVFDHPYIPDVTDLKAMSYFVKFYEDAGTIPSAEVLFLSGYDFLQLLQQIQTAHSELTADVDNLITEAVKKRIIKTNN